MFYLILHAHSHMHHMPPSLMASQFISHVVPDIKQLRQPLEVAIRDDLKL